MRITVDYVMSRDPCYDRDQIEEWMGDRAYVYPKTVLDMEELKPEDKLWLVLHPDFIPEKKLHLLACDFAERCDLSGQAKELVKAKRDWLAGVVSDEELDQKCAAYMAAYGAADWVYYWAAYWAADRAADRAAYWAADRAADRAAYGAAYWAPYWAYYWAAEEKKWQMETVKEALEEA